MKKPYMTEDGQVVEIEDDGPDEAEEYIPEPRPRPTPKSRLLEVLAMERRTGCSYAGICHVAKLQVEREAKRQAREAKRLAKEAK